MFGRRKKSEAKAFASEMLVNVVDTHVTSERMKASARASERPIVVLKPQIPLGAGQSAGWFGGNAALPKDMAWPERDGEKLHFVGQINLAALPKNLWSGLGPRSGWLGIFLPRQEVLQPTLLHFDGPLVDVKPPPPNSTDWTYRHDFKEPRTFALPKWPIIVESRPGNSLHEVEAPSASENNTPRTLLDPAFQPFDRDSTSFMFACLDDFVTGLAKQIIRFPATKKLRPADAAWFEQQKPIVYDTFVRFFEIEGRMRAAKQFKDGDVAGCIEALKDLNVADFDYLRNDDDGYCELALREAKLFDEQPALSGIPQWWHRYNAGLTNHGLNAYTSDPALLPGPLRERLEAKWELQTRDGLGAMGHAPKGHTYTPHGPDSPNELLLELYSSDLAGWIWGDLNSLIIAIDREALSRGDFSNVMFDITNG